MRNAHLEFLGVTTLALLWPQMTTVRAAEDHATDGRVGFEMKEVSIFDAKDAAILKDHLSGGMSNCAAEPDPAVKAYPKLKSKRPLYGKLIVDGNRFRGDAGTEYQFVLDASAPPKGAGAKSKSDGQWAIEDYDLIYFDANRDLDLTNDPVLVPMKDRPPGLSADTYWLKTKLFSCISLPVDYGPGISSRPLRLVPVLAEDEADCVFFMPTTFRYGTVRLGDTEFTALLAHASMPAVTSRFDQPMTGLILHPTSNAFDQARARVSTWWVELGAMRGLDGQLYKISATPTGDKLFVKPYRGDFGTLRVGSGGRDLKGFGVGGIFFSDSLGILMFGAEDEKFPAERRLPVGDYRAVVLSLDYGPLVFTGRAVDNPRHQASVGQFPIKIRKDPPFVVDFSAKPTVKFASPTSDQTFKSGEEVKFEALLVDPDLNVRVGRITDTSKKVGEVTRKNATGKEETVPEYASPEPTVVISDSTGKQMAKGTMPFG
jgi:hypothetical protein